MGDIVRWTDVIHRVVGLYEGCDEIVIEPCDCKWGGPFDILQQNVEFVERPAT